MNDREKWKAAVDHFISLEAEGSFRQHHADGTFSTWNVDSVKFEDSNRLLEVTHTKNRFTATFSLDEFVCLNCSPCPEPAKSEAEKLLESLKRGDVFWTQSADKDSIMKWIVVQATLPDYDAIAAYSTATPNVNLHGLDVSWFKRKNATATRPKTDREKELEKQVDYLHRELDSFSQSYSGSQTDLAHCHQRLAKEQSRTRELKTAATASACRISDLSAERTTALEVDKHSKKQARELTDQVCKLELELKDSKRVNQVTGDFQSMSDGALMKSKLRVEELVGISAKQGRKITSLKEKINHIREYAEAVNRESSLASYSIPMSKLMSEVRFV